MLLFTKFLCFILILVWGVFTLLFCVTIIPAIVLGAADQWDNWFCGGRRLIEKITQ